MQAATQAATEFVLTTEVKVSAVQQLFEADKASALAAEHATRAKKETECSTALKVRCMSQVHVGAYRNAVPLARRLAQTGCLHQYPQAKCYRHISEN